MTFTGLAIKEVAFQHLFAESMNQIFGLEIYTLTHL